MLTQVAEGVLVHHSERLQNNTVVVQGRAGVLLIDPGITADEMTCLAHDLREVGLPVVAGFSTHPHWDHLLWDSQFGSAPRYGTARSAAIAQKRLSDAGAKSRVAQMMPPDIADEVPLDLLGLISGLPDDTAHFPWDGRRSRLSSTERMPRVMRHCSSRNVGFSSPATCCPTSSFPCLT